MKQFVRNTLCLFTAILLSRPIAEAQCTGADNTTSTGANIVSGGASWINPNSVQSTDGSVASVSALISAFSIITTTSDYINVTNLGLSVPSANSICGVAVTINRQTFALLALGASTASDNSIKLIKGGAIVGTEHAATGVAWPTSLGAATYGNSSDLWGTTLTPADVNASNFGVAISTKLVAQILSVAFSAHIDQVTVTVYSQGILLPLELQNFTAQPSQQGNTLTWSVAGLAGGDSDRVSVQRSSDGVSGWHQLAVLDLASGPGGSPQQNYTDMNPLPGISFYRLCLVSPSGNTIYSSISSVSARSGPAVNIHTYPNPFTGQINITSPVPFTRLALRDAQGNTLWKKGYPAGVTNTSISASNLPGGIYFVQVDGTICQLIKN